MLFDAFFALRLKAAVPFLIPSLLFDSKQTKDDMMLQDGGNWKDSGEEEGAETTQLPSLDIKLHLILFRSIAQQPAYHLKGSLYPTKCMLSSFLQGFLFKVYCLKAEV